MASTTQNELYKTFAAVSGGQSSNLSGVVSSLADVVLQIGKSVTGQTEQAQAQKGASTLSGKGIAGTVDLRTRLPFDRGGREE